MLGVFDYLAGVGLEFRLEGFGEGDGFAGVDVIVWAALEAGEYCAVDVFGVFFFTHNNRAAWAAKGFVGGCHDDIEEWHG